MIAHSYVDEDPRVRREAEALVAAGHEVDVFGLRRPGDAGAGELDGFRLHRLDVQRHQGAGLAVYLREYLSFLGRSGWALARAHRSRRYGLVQVHSLPDFLAFAALPVRLTGVPLVLDLHEAMPEFFRSRFPGASKPAVHRLLVAQELASIRIASSVLTVNEALAERLRTLGVRAGKVRIVANAPSLARFDPSAYPIRTFAADGTVRLVYAGALTPIYELDVVLDALARLRADRPELAITLDVYGRGDLEPAWRARVVEAGLDDRVRFHGRIALDDVPAAIAAADIGLSPTRRDRFTDVSLSTKTFESAAMGKAAIASRLPMVEATFPAGTVRTYEPGDSGSLAAAIRELVDDPVGREASIAATSAVVREQSWERESVAYVELIEELMRG